MNKLLRFGTVVCLFSVILLSCEQAGIKQSPPAGAPAGDSRFLALSSGAQVSDLSERELRMLFGLEKTKITASDAAKKVAAGSGKKIGMFTFGENEALSYDDKAGTFTVKVKGTKGGKSFDKTLTVSGFTHPYENTLLASIESQTGNKLIFNNVIEKNTALADFIAEANTAKGIGYTSFSYTLVGSDKTVSIGDHSAYELAAVLSEKAGKIKIDAEYAVKYKKYNGSGDESVELDPLSRKTVSAAEPYFTKEDVFKYILEEVKKDEGFIQTQNKFASEFYARAVTSNKTPAGLFNTSKLQKYRDIYQTKEDGEHLALPDIDAAILNPRSNGIKADDFAGKLDVTYYIATKNLIENIGSNGFIPATFTTTKTGFLKVDETAANNLFFFGLTKSSGNLSVWDAGTVQETFLVRETGDVGAADWLSANNNISLGYVLAANGSADFVGDKMLADKEDAFLSKGLNGKSILIKTVKISKAAGTRPLTVSITFEGINDGVDGKPIVLTARPSR
ncbi:lipoprotein 17-related variable surface protein [Treponema sp. HNW]|uniref:lipoprotein 17-related variable surface protein n=1 Tax=Treponema sp. HNW TaxID=3116654 RepID=UPI003D14BD23